MMALMRLTRDEFTKETPPEELVEHLKLKERAKKIALESQGDLESWQALMVDGQTAKAFMVPDDSGAGLRLRLRLRLRRRRRRRPRARRPSRRRSARRRRRAPPAAAASARARSASATPRRRCRRGARCRAGQGRQGQEGRGEQGRGEARGGGARLAKVRKSEEEEAASPRPRPSARNLCQPEPRRQRQLPADGAVPATLLELESEKQESCGSCARSRRRPSGRPCSRWSSSPRRRRPSARPPRWSRTRRSCSRRWPPGCAPAPPPPSPQPRPQWQLDLLAMAPAPAPAPAPSPPTSSRQRRASSRRSPSTLTSRLSRGSHRPSRRRRRRPCRPCRRSTRPARRRRSPRRRRPSCAPSAWWTPRDGQRGLRPHVRVPGLRLRAHPLPNLPRAGAQVDHLQLSGGALALAHGNEIRYRFRAPRRSTLARHRHAFPKLSNGCPWSVESIGVSRSRIGIFQKHCDIEFQFHLDTLSNFNAFHPPLNTGTLENWVWSKIGKIGPNSNLSQSWTVCDFPSFSVNGRM